MPVLKKLFSVFLLLAGIASAEELHLKDGTVLQGERIRNEDSVVVFKTRHGEMRVPVSEIDWTGSQSATPEAGKSEIADPSGQTLVLMPTAFTPPEGTWCFKDFELLFLTLSYSPTSSTSIAVGALFPINPSEFELFTFGVKQRLVQSEDGRNALAVDGDIITPVGQNVDGNASIWTATLIGSTTSQGILGFHGAFGLMGSFRAEAEGNILTVALGTDVRITPHAKFIAEFLRGSISSEDGSISVINVGFRLHGERLSADICGLRPLVEDDLDGLFLYPLINIGYRF